MKKNAGFTLVEIVLVIALIGVSATAIISLIDPVQQFRKTNDAKRKSDLRQLQSALELYRADQGAYPVAGAWPGLTCGNSLSSGVATYMQKIPCDPLQSSPQNTGNFYYIYGSDGSYYRLVACLENIRDPQKDAVNFNYGSGTYCNGTTNWSYTLMNP